MLFLRVFFTFLLQMKMRTFYLFSDKNDRVTRLTFASRISSRNEFLQKICFAENVLFFLLMTCCWFWQKSEIEVKSNQNVKNFAKRRGRHYKSGNSSTENCQKPFCKFIDLESKPKYFQGNFYDIYLMNCHTFELTFLIQ